MKTATYRNKAGQMRYCPVAESDEEMFGFSESGEGFCVGCGSTQGYVEPDARRYPCESCEEHLVFGFQELLIMGVLKLEGERD